MSAFEDTGSRPQRRHLGMTLPRPVKQAVLEAADVMGWATGQWVLTAAAEHGPRLREHLGGVRVAKRPRVEDATFTALYLTPEERAELDDQAVACGLNRSAFVTAVARLALGEELDTVSHELRPSGGATP